MLLSGVKNGHVINVRPDTCSAAVHGCQLSEYPWVPLYDQFTMHLHARESSTAHTAEVQLLIWYVRRWHRAGCFSSPLPL